MKVFENPMARLHFDDREAILYVTLNPDANIDHAVIRQHYKMIAEATGGKEHAVLIDAGNTFSISAQAFEFATDAEGLAKLKAAAFCGPTLVNRLQIMQMQKAVTFPTAVFFSREEALEWLRTQDH